MTQHTGEVIAKFVTTGDISLVPSIIIAMQEEDRVSEVLRFKNCFKALRNIAAHEPSSLIVALKAKENVGYLKIQIKDLSGSVLNLDMTQFVLWMFDMFEQTGIRLYVRFANTLFRLLYCVNSSTVSGYLPMNIPQSMTLLQQYLFVQDFLYDSYKKPKIFNTKDEYLVALSKDNAKVFWKMVVPSLLELEMMIFSNISNFGKSGVKYVVDIAVERDGSIQR